MRKSLLLAGALIFATSPAMAKEWTVDYANSHLGFIGTQGTSSFNGEFKKFTSAIDLDPEKSDGGHITANIDMTSASAGSSERDGYLPQTDWFDTKQFPQAQFASTTIRKTGDHTFIADGNLTIKGISKPISLPFTLVQDGDHWRAQGKVTILRQDFHVGLGQWANEQYVKYNVDVTVDIAAKPQ